MPTQEYKDVKKNTQSAVFRIMKNQKQVSTNKWVNKYTQMMEYSSTIKE